MQFRILGPLEVHTDTGERVGGGSRLRGLLAVLLLHANQPVSAERLAIALWGEDAGADAVKTVWVYVSRLRRALGEPDRLVTEPAGYRLRVESGELDAERFEALVSAAREAREGRRSARAAALLREALSLWRGPALAEFGFSPFVVAEANRLEERR